jgi:hypothetical protein
LQNWTTLDPRKLIAARRYTYTPSLAAEPEVTVPDVALPLGAAL